MFLQFKARHIKLKAEVYTKGSGLDLFRFNLVLMFTSILKRAFDLIWATINLKTDVSVCNISITFYVARNATFRRYIIITSLMTNRF